MSDRRTMERLVERDRTLETALRSGRLSPRELLQMVGERRRRMAAMRGERRRTLRPTGTTTFPVPPGGGEEGEYATGPRATVDVTMPIVTGTTFSIASGDVTALRSALQNWTYGDCIELAAGGQWNITGHQPLAFTTSSGWVEGARCLIRPSNWAALAAAHALASDGMPANLNLSNPRMTPSRAAALGTPKLRAVGQTIGVLKMQMQSRGLYVWGIDMDLDPAYSATANEFYWLFGTDLNDIATINDVDHIPYDCVVNQCLIRGYPGAYMRKAASMNIDHHAVVNSYLESHSVSFPESCPLWTCYGRGPFRWENNACVGAGILAFEGGIDLPSWHQGEFPRDGTIRHNYLHSPAKWNWYNPAKELTVRENMKNSFEWKFGEYMLFEYNLMDGSWDGGQNGQGMTIKMLNQASEMDWASTGNLILRYNKQINTGSGWDILGNQQTGDGSSTQLGKQVHRLHAHNNLTIVSDIHSEIWKGAHGRLGIWSAVPISSELSGGVDPSWVFEHNTWITRTDHPTLPAGDGDYNIGFQMQGSWSGAYPVHRNSVFSRVSWKWLGRDGGGTPEFIMNTACPGTVLDNNAFGKASSGANEFGAYEAGNFFAASDAALGLDVFTGELDPASPCKSGGAFQADDGSDNGADVATIEANLVNVDLWE